MLSFIDGEKGILKYCGYAIDDLAASSSFEEVVCLLYDRELPSPERLATMRACIGAARVLPSEVVSETRELTVFSSSSRMGLHFIRQLVLG